MEGLIEGRIVHYVMPDGQHRPAVVVRVWNSPGHEGLANLQAITDGTNDVVTGAPAEAAKGLMWATSVENDETEKKPGTWHWIERA